jgi:hypothetical protein
MSMKNLKSNFYSNKVILRVTLGELVAVRFSISKLQVRDLELLQQIQMFYHSLYKMEVRMQHQAKMDTKSM